MRAFPDEAEITVRGGHGGAGCVSFHRARFQPRGRPDGGNGGAGGDVILEASEHTRTLAYFRRRRLFQADRGQPGGKQDRLGKSGSPLIVIVPPGTLVHDADSGNFLGELLSPGDRLVVARGGRGGKGNAHFTSSRLRSPRFAQPGEPGEERRLRLELQVLADVGLIGAPNAGKTSLLRALTASSARVDVFPFTTLTPQLGVLQTDPALAAKPIILAEIPGLIPDAHKGKGLGLRFLRHLRRTRLLVQVIDISRIEPENPLGPMEELEREMRAFDPRLLLRPRLIALNKIDLISPEFPLEQVMQEYRRAGPVFPVSAATGEGLVPLRQAVLEEIARLGDDKEPEQALE
ncbi:MAG: GTPase ObgE [Deltaproteobacteria bacterium]|nr:GTPase ObgE [Deltaproteobacteria bacterium]